MLDAAALLEIDVAADDAEPLGERLHTAVQLLRSALLMLGATTQVALRSTGWSATVSRCGPSPFFAAHKEIGSGNSPDAV